MVCLLRMPVEIHGWLAALCRSDPSRAWQSGQALTALLTTGPATGPPLVRVVTGPARAPATGEELEDFYQYGMRRLRALRRRAADTASRSLQTPSLGGGQVPETAQSAADDPGPAQISQQLTVQAQRLQRLLDAYRVSATRLTAARTAALAGQVPFAPLPDTDGAGGDGDRYGPDPDVVAAEQRVLELEHRIGQEAGDGSALLDLLELRPADDSVRFLFTFDPPVVAQLLTVLDGHEAIAQHYGDAVALAASLLRHIRSRQDSPQHSHDYDAQALLGEFFPGQAS